MRGRVRKYIDDKFKELTQKHIIPSTPILPVGYNSLECIRGALFQWMPVPFKGEEIWCQLRCLNQTQIEACGDVSSLKFDDQKAPTKDELIKMRNFQESICRAVLNIPLFDEIGKVIGAYDFVLSEKRKELADIRKMIGDNTDSLTEVELNDLNVRADALELFLGYILPSDTMDFLTFWAMGNDVSDIRKLSRDKLLEAAILAERSKKAPSDYLSGVYTDHNKADIDRHAWIIFNDFVEQKNIEAGVNGKKGDKKFVGGPKGKRG